MKLRNLFFIMLATMVIFSCKKKDDEVVTLPDNVIEDVTGLTFQVTWTGTVFDLDVDLLKNGSVIASAEAESTNGTVGETLQLLNANPNTTDADYTIRSYHYAGTGTTTITLKVTGIASGKVYTLPTVTSSYASPFGRPAKIVKVGNKFTITPN